MNILFLMGAFPQWGGVEVVSTILSNEFISRGHNVSIVSFEQPILDRKPMPLNPKVKFYPLSKPTYSEENIGKLHEILVGDRVDVLISQWVVPYFVARLCRKAMKGTDCKLISVHHNIPNSNSQIEKARLALSDGKGRKTLNKLRLQLVTLVSRLSLRYTVSNSDKYVVLSPSFIPIAEKYTWMKNDGKMLSIANPLTIEPNTHPAAAKKKEIIYVGRIMYNQKCTYRIVDIWEKLEKRHQDWCLKIVGDGPDREDLQRRIDEKKLQNVTIEGYQNPLGYYQTASMLLLTSAYEGFGLVLTECMEYGVVPVVYNSYTALKDIVDDGINGYAIPQPYTDDAFVEKIEYLMANQSRLHEMSQAAMQKAKMFSIGSVVEKWEELFAQLCGKEYQKHAVTPQIAVSDNMEMENKHIKSNNTNGGGNLGFLLRTASFVNERAA